MAHFPKIGVAFTLAGFMHLAGALEINLANEAELDSVRGFGPETTARILLAREQAPFVGWSDLMRRVKGIKSATAARLSSSGLTVNGMSFGVSAVVPAVQVQPPADSLPP